jgi:hypothetical protein
VETLANYGIDPRTNQTQSKKTVDKKYQVEESCSGVVGGVRREL